MLISTRQLTDQINEAKTRSDKLKAEEIELKNQIKATTDRIELNNLKRKLLRVKLEGDSQNSIIKSQRYNLILDGKLIHENLQVIYAKNGGIMFEYINKNKQLSTLYIQVNDNPLLEEVEDGYLTDPELDGGKVRKSRRKSRKLKRRLSKSKKNLK